MPRTVALTGATGFIGSALAHRFHTLGWAVRALVRSSSRSGHLAAIPIQCIEGDLNNLERLHCLVDGVDDVVHCAGLVRGVSLTDFESANVVGVENVLRVVCEQDQVPRFLLMSSLTAREPSVSPYARSKYQGEAKLAIRAKDMAWTVLRPPAVYGLGDRELRPLLEWMGRGIALQLGHAQARFSLLHVDDLVDAVVMCIDSAHSTNQVLELHDGYAGGYRWSDVIDIVERTCKRRVLRVSVPEALLQSVAFCNTTLSRVTGRAPMVTLGKVRELRHSNWVCDNAAMLAAVGWMPKITLDQGLRRTFAWGVGAHSSASSDTMASSRQDS